MFGRCSAMDVHFLPSFRLAHTSPLVVPKYRPTGSCASHAILWRITVNHARLGSPPSNRFQLLPALRVIKTLGFPSGLVLGHTVEPSIGNTHTISGSRGWRT